MAQGPTSGRAQDQSAPRPRRNTRPRDELGRPLPYGAVGAQEESAPAPDSSRETLVAAHRLLSAGRPFHAHELLEQAWKAAPAGERELWRGLAQLAVGSTHAARGNATGAVRLIERGARAIAPYEPARPLGVDVGAVLAWARRAADELGAVADAPVTLSPPPLLPRDDA